MPAPAAADAPASARAWPQRSLVPLALVLAVAVALAAGALTLAWTQQQRLKLLEAELGKRQQEAAQSAAEARTLARAAEVAAREAVAKAALFEARLSETALQRSQFEDLLQGLARSRDENVLADIEAAVRVAQQQAAITGGSEPLLLVLRQAEERLARYGQPRLERVRRAVVQDLERTRAAGGADIALLTSRIDEVARQIDELPLLVQPPPAATGRRAAAGTAGTATGGHATLAPAPAPAAASTAAAAASAPAIGPLDTLRQAWDRLVAQVWSETRSLVRVTRIADPEAMLVAPEQAYFLRENVKLRLLNARLALLSRQFDIAQSDLREAREAIERYFDRSARRAAQAADALRQLQMQARSVVLPRPDATLAAIAAASAGR